MTPVFILHRIIAFVINGLAIGLIIYYVLSTDSDKSPILFMVFYPALMLVNLSVLVVLAVQRKQQAKIYRQIVFVELMLLLPLIFVLSQF